jgi:hypothetical protein
MPTEVPTHHFDLCRFSHLLDLTKPVPEPVKTLPVIMGTVLESTGTGSSQTT